MDQIMSKTKFRPKVENLIILCSRKWIYCGLEYKNRRSP